MSDLTPEEQACADEASRQLRLQERQISPEIADALAQARSRALAQHVGDGGNDARFKWWQVSGAGAAVSAILLLAVYSGMSDPASESELIPLPQMNEIEMAAAQEAELLEDLEFVAWILALEEPDAQPSQG